MVTVIVGTVVGLTFLFGLGNVAALGIRLGIPTYVAILVAPAVDLSVVGLLIGARHLSLHGGPADVIRAARRLLIFASAVTLALNIAEPLISGHYGRAAFDAVGPLLLIGWAEVGPGLLQAIQTTSRFPVFHPTSRAEGTDQPQMPATPDRTEPTSDTSRQTKREARQTKREARQTKREARQQDLLHRARAEDVLHWQHQHRPISAETLRKRLHIGSDTARTLVTQIRRDTGATVNRR